MNIIGQIVFWVSYNARKIIEFWIYIGKFLWAFYNSFDAFMNALVGLVLIFLLYAFNGVGWLLTHLTTISDLIQNGSGITGGDPVPPALAQGFAIANSFLPLNEAFVIFQYLALVWVLTTTFRLVKSWLPSVN